MSFSAAETASSNSGSYQNFAIGVNQTGRKSHNVPTAASPTAAIATLASRLRISLIQEDGFGSEADSAIVSKATRRCVNGRLGEEEEHDTCDCQEIWARGQGFISDRIVAESTAESLNGLGHMEIFLSRAVRNER